WTVVKASRPDRGISLLDSVTVVSATEAWAAGESLDRDFSNIKPLFEHWNGTAWSIVPSPSLGGDGSIGDIAAVATDDVWAVGRGPAGVLVEHWDGTSWAIVPAPSSNVYSLLYSVSATSADDVWAAGTAEHTGRASDPLVEHWDGSAWSVELVPASPKQAEQLAGVTAISPSEVWADGESYSRHGVFTGS